MLALTDIQAFADKPMNVPKWPCHGQGVERCLKLVMEASTQVCSHEKRNGFIKTQQVNDQIMKKNESK